MYPLVQVDELGGVEIGGETGVVGATVIPVVKETTGAEAVVEGTVGVIVAAPVVDGTDGVEAAAAVVDEAAADVELWLTKFS